MTTEFSGRTLRVAVAGARGGDYREAFYLGLRDQAADRRLIAHLVRNERRAWVSDVYEFADCSKLIPALVYRRMVASDLDPELFVDQYLGSKAGATGDSRPAHIDIIPGYTARSVEERWLLLDQTRPFAGASDDDPWFDVATGYSYLSARALARTEGGYEDSLWFMSVGPGDDGLVLLQDSVRAHLARSSGSLIVLQGPGSVYHHGTPASGMVLARSAHHMTGDDEFIARFVEFAGW